MLDWPIPAIRICTAPHAVYVAHLVDHALKKLGLESRIEPNFVEENDNGEIYVIICPSYFEKLPRNYIVYQLEQLGNSKFYNEDYRKKLENSLAILDYSRNNIDFLAKNGFSSQKLNLLKISCFPVQVYKQYLFNQGLIDLDEKEKDIDILFYGNDNVLRRKMIISELNDTFGITSITGVYGRDIYNAILRSKIVLNLHFYDNALLEVVRIFESLSLGIPVVSEESHDIDVYPQLNKIVDFFPAGNPKYCGAKISHLLGKPEEYQKKLSRLYEYCSGSHDFVENLGNFLLKSGGKLQDTNIFLAPGNFPKQVSDLPNLAKKRLLVLR